MRVKRVVALCRLHLGCGVDGESAVSAARWSSRIWCRRRERSERDAMELKDFVSAARVWCPQRGSVFAVREAAALAREVRREAAALAHGVHRTCASLIGAEQ